VSDKDAMTTSAKACMFFPSSNAGWIAHQETAQEFKENSTIFSGSIS